MSRIRQFRALESKQNFRNVLNFVSTFMVRVSNILAEFAVECKMENVFLDSSQSYSYLILMCNLKFSVFPKKHKVLDDMERKGC